jgi:hypothetical protein
MESFFLDVVKNATGVMCSCMLSSCSLARGKMPDWSMHTHMPDTVEGGRVFSPIRAYHENVVVVDSKSMYLKITLCAFISYDNVTSYVDEVNDQ